MFAFRLEALLRLREKHEQEAMAFYAERLRDLASEKSEHERLEIALKKCFSERENLERYFLTEERIIFLREAIKKQLAVLDKAVKRVAAALADWQKRRTEKEILEKLKEKDLKKYRKDRSKKERKVLDELHIMSWGRKEKS